MKTLTLILGCLIIAAFFLAPYVQAACKRTPFLKTIKRSFGFAAGTIRINALGDGTHPSGILSFKADAAIAVRHYLVKAGSDAYHTAVCAAASDEPKGVCFDEADAAEDPVAVQLLGAIKGTVLMVAGETIAVDKDVYSKGDGTIQDEPTVAGTYWKVGKSRSASTVGIEIEVEPILPQKVVIIANAANLATTQAAMTGGAIVIVLGA